MKKAVFLDRDGVINRERGEYTYHHSDFEILPEVVPALKLAQSKGYLLVVISNQGGIAKGIFSQQRVEELHAELTRKLAVDDILLNAIYYCPHHSEVGKCLCRKPGTLMLQKAMARFQIDPSKSIMIGDGERDVEAAEKVGVKGILIPSNSGILSLIQELK